MNGKHRRVNTCVLISLLGGSMPLLACPDMQGTYQVADSQAFLYLKKQQKEDYAALIKDEEGTLSMLPVISVSEEDRKEQKIPECALIIQRLGVFMPVAKGQSFTVTTQSQEYVSTKTPGTDYVIRVMSGFYSDVIGIDKTAVTLPADALKAFSQP